MPEQSPLLVIACGALAREVQAIKKHYQWTHLVLKCLDADLHNRPALIPQKLRSMILRYRADYPNIFVAYGDCGTGGKIDEVLAEFGIERLTGPHCYAVFAGEHSFQQRCEEEPGTFYLTDFLVRHFRRLVIDGLKLDIYPGLRDQIFGNYTRVIYLSQTADTNLVEAARGVADYLQLRFEHLHTGYGGLSAELENRVIATG